MNNNGHTNFEFRTCVILESSCHAQCKAVGLHICDSVN